MDTTEITNKLKELQALDKTDDLAIANGLNSIIDEITGLGAKFTECETEMQSLKDANTKLKAKNFDLLNRTGTQTAKEEPKRVDLNDAVNDYIKNM